MPLFVSPSEKPSTGQRWRTSRPRLALRFVAFTGSRIGNVVDAKWSEFDLESDTPSSTIPRARMKVRDRTHDHRVLLGPTMLDHIHDNAVGRLQSRRTTRGAAPDDALVGCAIRRGAARGSTMSRPSREDLEKLLTDLAVGPMHLPADNDSEEALIALPIIQGGKVIRHTTEP